MPPRFFSPSFFAASFLLAALVVAPSPLCAEDASAQKLPAWIGVGGTYGFTGVVEMDTTKNEEWIGDRLWGGGLVLEKMFTARFGLHSGVWYTKNYTRVRFAPNSVPDDFLIEYIGLTMPVYGMASVSVGSLTFSILAGVCFTYITESYIIADFPDRRMTTNVLKFTNYTQEGVGGGIEVKLRVSQNIDVFIAGTAERYLSEYIVTSDNNPSCKLFTYEVKLGVLHRAY